MSSIVTVDFLGNSKQLESTTQSVRRLFSDFDGDLGKLSQRMDMAGRNMTRSFTLPIVAAAGGAVAAFARYDDKLNQSLSIMGEVSGPAKERMVAATKEVASTTRFGADQAAEAYFFLASAGLDAEASVAAMPQVAKFAQAGMFDLARATDLATDAQSALGLTSDDADENLANLTRTTDVLVAANTLANASVEQFSTALTTKAGAALKVANKEVEEGVAVLAAFADQGIKGEEAGTALANVLQVTARQAAVNADDFDDLGLSVLDADGNLRNMADVVAEFERVLGGMSDADRAATLAKLGLTRQTGNALQALLGTSDAIRGYESDLGDAAGTTQRVADNQMESLSAQLDVAKNQAILGAQAFGEVLAPAVAAGAGVFADMAGAVSDLPSGITNTAVAIAGATAAAGPLLRVGGKVVGMLGRYRAATDAVTSAAALGGGAVGRFTTAGAGLAAMLGPAGLLIGGLAAGAAGVLAIKHAAETTDRAVLTSAEAYEAWAASVKANAGDTEQSVKDLSKTVRQELRAMTPDRAEAYLIQLGWDMVRKDGMNPDEVIEHLDQIAKDAFGDDYVLNFSAEGFEDIDTLTDAIRRDVEGFATAMQNEIGDRATTGWSSYVAKVAEVKQRTQELDSVAGRLADTFAGGDIEAWVAQFSAAEQAMVDAGLEGALLREGVDILTDSFVTQAGWTETNTAGYDNLTSLLADATTGTSDLTQSSIDLVREAQTLAEAEGITLVDALGRVESRQRQAAEATDDAADSSQDAAGALDEQAEATEDLNEEAEEQISLQQQWADKLRANIDPVFAVTKAQQRYDDALKKLKNTQDDAEASAQDVADAEREVAEAGVDLRGELARVVDSQGNVTQSAQKVQQMLEDIGLPPAVVRRVMADFGSMEKSAKDLDAVDPDLDVRVRKAQAWRHMDQTQRKAEAVDREQINIETSVADTALEQLGRLGDRIAYIDRQRITVSTGVSGAGGRYLVGTSHTGDLITPSMPGRLPGMRHDERMRALQVGEEVLAPTDPRHIRNRGRTPALVAERAGDHVEINLTVPDGPTAREVAAEIDWRLRSRRR